MNGKMTSAGPMGGGGTMVGADGGASGIVTDVPPTPEGPGLGMNTGDSDLLLLIVLLQLLRRLRSPLRNV